MVQIRGERSFTGALLREEKLGKERYKALGQR